MDSSPISQHQEPCVAAIELGQHIQAPGIDMWLYLGAGSLDMEIYVWRGRILQRIKLIHAEHFLNLQWFFIWDERKRL